MSCQVEGHTHTCPGNLLSLPLLPCGRHRALGQILPRRVTWANDVHCLDLSLLPSKLGRRMLAGRLPAPNVNALQAVGGEGPGVFRPPSRDSHSLFGALGAGSRNSS